MGKAGEIGKSVNSQVFDLMRRRLHALSQSRRAASILLQATTAFALRGEA